MNLISRCVKYILFLANICCMILGALLLITGVWLLRNADALHIDYDENLAAILTIVLGSTVLTVGCFGCAAALIESRSMLISYAVILSFLFVVQLILLSFCYAAASNDAVPAGIKNGFDDLVYYAEREEEYYNSNNYNNTTNKHNNNTLNYYEEWLECCGKNSAEDYLLLDRIPPASCCKDRDCTNVLNLYMIGCEHKHREYIRSKTSSFNTISWWLIVIEFLGSVAACIQIDSLRDHRDRIRLYS